MTEPIQLEEKKAEFERTLFEFINSECRKFKDETNHTIGSIEILFMNFSELGQEFGWYQPIKVMATTVYPGV
jgi:hypothetical protein